MRSRPLLLPIAAILLAMLSIQYGASLAKSLFPVLGPVGATTVRLVLGAAMLLVACRPWRGDSLAGSRRALVGYGTALGLMNLFYYLALERVPMGLVVAIEFLGPLSVALCASRRAVDFVWVALAAVGLTLLLPVWPGADAVDLLGIGYALLAGIGWAFYIVFGTQAGLAHGGRVVALGMIVGALVVLPIGLVARGSQLLIGAVLPLAAAVAVLSSVLPYLLEMWAMTRLPMRTFGVFMSVEPALAALIGLATLGEALSPLQWLAIGCVMLASLGSAATSAHRPPESEQEFTRTSPGA